MPFAENPITRSLHNLWERKISLRFPELGFSKDLFPFSLIQYLERSPNKFFNNSAYIEYLNFLNSMLQSQPEILANLLKEYSTSISLANKITAEINLRPIHENHLPKDEHDLIRFIDQEINYSLLQLYETPYYHFLLIVSKCQRIIKSKGTDGLDLFNVIQDLSNTDFSKVCELYNNTLRNGIAHGKVSFTNSEIVFADKKGKSFSIYPRDIVRLFDKLLDCCNGLCLAFKVFSFSNHAFFEKYKIPVPQSILMEELQAKIETPGWKLLYSYEGVNIHRTDQLNIIIKNSFWDLNKVYYSCFQTAYLAEAITKSYSRIFLSLKSDHSYDGWAAFSGKTLAELRQKNSSSIVEYARALENNLVFFKSRIPFPRFIYKLGTLYASISANYKVFKNDWREKVVHRKWLFRETQIHSKRFFTVVQDTSIIVSPTDKNDVIDLIRNSYREIIRKAIKFSRKKCGPFSKSRWLPVRYVRVFIYDEDLRERSLRNSGLIPQLIATIQVNTSRKIKVPDIFNSTVEQIGKYRIVWFNGWRGNQNNSLIKTDMV